ncbi:mRNA decapping enzyme [Yokapox virus]|uniref:mRNA decapping enzyme n=1 Tax=Yokapox virus TaxID=1076255 RepID=G3EIH4_9POXV|nr:mRNA decapping enzyme [Yokapox virus]AEN03685.1 mRNA decapping enzyme [Yokapox virus]
MNNLFRSSIIHQIIKYNRQLSKSIILMDDTQIITLTPFVYNFLWNLYRISICAILITADNKILVCDRRNSFLYSEIMRTKNMTRKKRLFINYSKYLNKHEKNKLLSLFSSNNDEKNEILSFFSYGNDDINDRHEIIYPGGLPKKGEDVSTCLYREIKEEVNLDNSYIFIDSRFFIHGIIEDKIINKFFDVIFFFGSIKLSSSQIIDKFKSNKEIKDLIFIDINTGNGLQHDIAKYAIQTSKCKCHGHNGFQYGSLKRVN